MEASYFPQDSDESHLCCLFTFTGDFDAVFCSERVLFGGLGLLVLDLELLTLAFLVCRCDLGLELVDFLEDVLELIVEGDALAFLAPYLPPFCVAFLA